MRLKEVKSLHTALYQTRETLLRAHQFESLWRLCEIAPRGDFVECGVYKGGACALMAQYPRTLWMFDSWEGLPDEENTKYGFRENEGGKPQGCMSSLTNCVTTLNGQGVLRENLIFVKGWFKDTLSRYNGEIALLRLDGDFYSSTMEALEELYPKVVPGGYVIIDDYCFEPCRDATREYRNTHNITSPLMGSDDTPIGDDWKEDVRSRYTGIWWQKPPY